jgi:hypothetical protein
MPILRRSTAALYEEDPMAGSVLTGQQLANDSF